MSKVRLLAAAALLAFGLAAHAGTRVQAANLTYQGKFNVPTSEATCNGAGNTLGWMAPGMTYHPANDSLYLFGRDAQGSCVAEITTPAINGTATFIQALGDCTNGHLGDIPGSGNAVIGGGLLVYNGKLWCNYFAYYDSGFQQTASLFSHGLTLSNHTGATGPAVIANGGTQAGYVSGYMAHVPAAWQAALGGPVVVGNCCLSVITRTSYGPALFGFNPESPGTSSPLVYYNSAHPTLGTFGEEGPPANTAFSPTTKVTGVALIEGTDSALFFGSTGTGAYCYGTGTACSDPSSDASGVHMYPYRARVWAYDLDDLAAVKAGTIQPWQAVPYAMWELSDLGNTTDVDNGLCGIGYDAANSTLYICKMRQQANGIPDIHVYTLTGLGGGLLPGPSNFRRIPQ